MLLSCHVFADGTFIGPEMVVVGKFANVQTQLKKFTAYILRLVDSY